MSSLIGHSLAGLSVFYWQKQPALSSRRKWGLVWLIIIASAPDIDYLVPYLQAKNHQGIRITHSIVVALLLPIATAVALSLFSSQKREAGDRFPQTISAGLSHLVLDMLVGVTPLPLLWPFSPQLFKLPFGILPSAGKLNLFNYFLYQNLFIELSVLVPLFYSIYLLRYGGITTRRQKVIIASLLMVSFYFMYGAFTLSR